MKRSFMLFCAIILLSSCAKTALPHKEEIAEQPTIAASNYRTVEQVKTIALSAVEEFSSTSTKSSEKHICSIIPQHSLQTKSSSENPLFYIVNFDNDEGFVMVGAATNSPEVIVYAERGNYDGGITQNEGFNMYVSEITDHLASISGIEIPTDPTHYEYETTNTTSNQINPLVSVSWHQDQPFNWYCSNPFRDIVPAGCVAIAIAQIMTTHSSPASISLTYPNAHAASIALDWANMTQDTHTYVHDYTCPYCIQNAALVREIGERVDMIYQDGCSTAYSSKVKGALNSFGYSCDNYNDYSLSSVLSSLEIGRPVYTFGVNSGENVGHVWVIDGSKHTIKTTLTYEVSSSSKKLVGTNRIEDDYLHFNYGWDGYRDGYYLARRHEKANGPDVYGGSIDEYTVTMFTGIGYNKSVGVITNIRPN